MTEILVAISVMSVLFAILAPAVISVREVSRKTTCKNNLRQIGLALQQYVAVFGQFPKTARGGPSHVHLLPHLDNANTYSTYVANSRPWTVAEAKSIPRIPVFVCPSDLNASRPQALSYAENRGYSVGNGERMTLDAWPRHNGVFQHARCRFVLRPASVSDGLSNTTAYAELLSLPRPRQMMFAANPHDWARSASATALIQHCRMVATFGIARVMRGDNWLSSSLSSSGYLHLLTPNGKNCIFQPCAGSDHAGGVQTALCDGSVRWVSNEVDTQVWIGLGSFAGIHEY